MGSRKIKGPGYTMREPSETAPWSFERAIDRPVERQRNGWWRGRCGTEQGLSRESVAERRIRRGERLPRMEREGRIIAEAVEKIVEEKVRKMLRERKEDDRKKDEKLEEKVRSLERKVERIEQSGDKRKREEYEESVTEKKKWWAGEGEKNEDELRKRNVILRVEKEKWGGKESNWEKVKELFAEGLKVRVTVREVIVVGQRRIWMTILVKLGNEEEKWRVLEARRKAGNSIGVNIHEDKSVERRDRERERRERRKWKGGCAGVQGGRRRKKLQEGWRRNCSWPPMMRRRRMGERGTGLNREELRREGGRLKDGVAAGTKEEEEG
ncbi:hypothetical protein DBV15_11687 [Temnothorax longispinosus]|uniref:Uncharacterized protein n=1 Tax=Temnothorax longispinosus TaxID=300112 RepID=A0A4S2JBK1_9HYME|nr:hypothetical protein DBV15_11687 [Temnothorax longispinosus]